MDEKEIFKGWPERYNFDWSLDALKTNFTHYVPQWIKDETRETELPFPPELISGITEEDVSFLQEIFALSEREKYSEWVTVYQSINLELLGHAKGANQLVYEMKALAGEKIHFPCLFLAVAHAYLSLHDKGVLIKWSRQAKDEIKAIQKTPEQSQKTRQRLAINEAIRNIRHKSDVVPLTNSENDSSPAILKAFNGVSFLFKKYPSPPRKDKRRQWGPRQKTVEMFDLWGIRVNQDAARQAKRDRKRQAEKTVTSSPKK